MSENIHNYSSSNNCKNNYLVQVQGQGFLRRNPDMERLEEYSRKQSEMIQTLTQALANEKKRNQIMVLINEVDNLPPQTIEDDADDEDVFNVHSNCSSQDSLIVHAPNSANLLKFIFSKTSIGTYSSSTDKMANKPSELLPEKSMSRYDINDGSNSVSGLRLKGKSVSGIQLVHPNVNTNISCRSRSFSTSKSNFNMAGSPSPSLQYQQYYPMYQYAYPGFNYPGADLSPPNKPQIEKLRPEPSPGSPPVVKSSIIPILIPAAPPKKINSRISDKVIFPIPMYNSNPTVGGRSRKQQLKIPWQIRETAKRMTTAYLDAAEIKNKESLDLNGNGQLPIDLNRRASFEVNRAEVPASPRDKRSSAKSRRNFKKSSRSKSKIKDQCFILVKNNPINKTTTTTTSSNPKRLVQDDEKRVRITEPLKYEDSEGIEDDYPEPTTGKHHVLEKKVSRHVKEDTSLIDAIMSLCQEHRNRNINGQNDVQLSPKLQHPHGKKESNEVLSLFRKFSRNDRQKSTIINDAEELDGGLLTGGGPPFAERKKIQHKTMLDDLGCALDKMLVDKENNLQNKKTKYANNVQKFFKNEPTPIKPSANHLRLNRSQVQEVNYNNKTYNKTIHMIFQNQKKIRTTTPSVISPSSTLPKVPGSKIFPKSELDRNKSFLNSQIEKLKLTNNHNIPEGFEETLIYLTQTINQQKTLVDDKKPSKPPGEPLEELSKMLKIESEKLEKRRKLEDDSQAFPRWLKSKFNDKKSSINQPQSQPKAINRNYRKSLNLSDLTLEDRAKFKININPRGVDCNCCLDHRQNILNFINKKKPPISVDFEATKSKYRKYFVNGSTNANNRVSKGSTESSQKPSITAISSTCTLPPSSLIKENLNNFNSNKNDTWSNTSINCPKNLIKISQIPFH